MERTVIVTADQQPRPPRPWGAAFSVCTGHRDEATLNPTLPR